MVHTPRRGACPPELTSNAVRWTERHQKYPNRDWATPTAKRILRSALREMAHGKCAYCESALEVTSFLQIDHYIAKTVEPHRVFEWGNLLPACVICNNAKADEDHRGALLKPDDEDPEPFFWIHPDSGRLEPHPALDAAGQRRAAETIRICDLQRPKLCQKRIDMWIQVTDWLQHQTHTASARLFDPRYEYKLVLRHVLTLKRQPELAALDRSRFLAGD